MTSKPGDFHVAMNLWRWENTVVSLSFKERLAALFTGRLGFVQEEAPGTPISSARRRLIE